MPIYEYQCESCRHQLEVLQKISESPLTCCPACGKSALKKLMSASAFRLKGSGWYETDFKTGDKKKGRKVAHEAIEMAKAPGMDYSGTQDLIDQHTK